MQRTYDLIFICKKRQHIFEKSLNSENYISVLESFSFIFPIIATNEEYFSSNDNTFTLTSSLSFI